VADGQQIKNGAGVSDNQPHQRPRRCRP
jgi:hypothetical protein